MDLGQLALKGTELALGLSLLYFRFFLYESEEGRLQNALVELWIRVSDHAQTARMRFVRLLEETARLSLHGFDRLFGPRLFSAQAFAVSGLLGCASFALTVFLQQHDPTSRLRYAESIAVFVVVALIPALIRRAWALWIPLTAAMVTLVVFGFEARYALKTHQSLALISMAGVVMVPFVDFLWLVLYRKATERALDRRQISAYIAAIMSGPYVTYLTMALPYLAKDFSNSLTNPVLTSRILTLGTFLFAIAVSRYFLSAISLTQLAILMLAGAHWVIWPLFSRVVYAAERFQLFKERKLFGTCGSALLLHASVGIGWVVSVLKTVMT